MKRIFTILACAALIVCACDELKPDNGNENGGEQNGEVNKPVEKKDPVAYSFAKESAKLTSEVEVVLNLIGETGDEEFTLPFVIDDASTAAAADFEVKDGATAFVFGKGSKSASITLVSKMTELPAEALTVIVALDKDAIAEAYPERFNEDGVNLTFTALLTSAPMFDDFEGKWAYESAVILDNPDAEYSLMIFEAMFDGDTIDEHPTGTSSDILEFKNVDGTQKLIPSGNGAVMNYFKECEVSGFDATQYNWYWGWETEMGTTYDVAEITLSTANVAYSAANPLEREASIYAFVEENTLTVFIYDYIPTDFFESTYDRYKDMWEDYFALYYDLCFTFTKVTE